MSQQIIVKKQYFDNIKVAIDAMNNFFASNFKTKTFPVIDNNFQLDRIIARTISWLNNVEPSWVEDTKNASASVDKLRSFISQGDAETPGAVNPKWEELISGKDQVATDNLHAYIGFKVLQYITENFESYEKLLNGIYSFELFTKPSKFRQEIEMFTAPLELTELEQDGPIPGEYKLFNSEDYIHSIFENDQIKLPENMVADIEVQRFNSFTDLEDTEIVIDDTVQEAAEINYFKDAKPEHIRYIPGSKKFQVSKQFSAAVDKIISAFKKCDTTEDLADVFNNWMDDKSNLPSPDLFSKNIIPCILARVFNSTKKFPFDMYDVEQMGLFTKSYKSIVSKNKGAKRFANMDLFSVFKTDKEGTLKFLEDFLKLNLVNDENAVIQNSTTRTIFNIFDSRIYLDILYNLIPEATRTKDGMTEDSFVKEIRGKINANSRNANPYQADKKLSDTIETSDQVSEYVFDVFKQYSDLSIADLQYCEQFSDAVHEEIETLGDALYNKGVSQIMIGKYIQEEDESVTDGTDDTSDSEESSDADMGESDGEGESIQEAATAAPLMTVQNQLRHLLSDTFTFMGNGMIPKFNMKSKEKPEVSFDVALNGNNVECTPKYNGIPDNVNKRRGIAPMRSANVIADFVKSVVAKFKSGSPLIREYTTSFQEGLLDKDITPAETGDIPDYMKKRIDIQDKKDKEQNKPEPTVTDVQLPPDVPINPADDLAESIDARLDSDSDNLGDMLGSGYPGSIKPAANGGPGTVVYNITNNNYSNSHNTTTTTTNDLSSNKKSSNVTKTTTDNSSHDRTSTVTNTSYDLSTNKQANTRPRGNKPINNYDNTSNPTNTKDSSNTLSTGKTVNEVFALLESEEPLFVEGSAGDPPKGDILTTSMDIDKNTLSLQQKLKQGAGKIVGTGKALAKPVSRTKQWIHKMVDSLIKRDENKIKDDILNSSSYRSAIYKVSRIAIKGGMFTVLATIQPWLGFAYAAKQGLDLADRQRLKKEVQSEVGVEIQIMDQKINDLKNAYTLTEEKRQELYKLMRMRQKMVNMIADSTKQTVVSRKSVY